MGKMPEAQNFLIPPRICIYSQYSFTQTNRIQTCIDRYSKMSLLRPPSIKTTSLLRPVFASPKWYFLYHIIFDIKTTSLIRPLLGSPKGGLNIGILLYIVSTSQRMLLDCTILHYWPIRDFRLELCNQSNFNCL